MLRESPTYFKSINIVGIYISVLSIETSEVTDLTTYDSMFLHEHA